MLQMDIFIKNDDYSPSPYSHQAAYFPFMNEKHEIAARKRLGAVLERLRKEHDLSQQALALECDMDRTYYGGIERGERNPSLKNILKLCRVLEISAADLFREAGL
jgi:DNA-binding XRE family transcriptional regulator